VTEQIEKRVGRYGTSSTPTTSELGFYAQRLGFDLPVEEAITAISAESLRQ
jgi:hypothetical protein